MIRFAPCTEEIVALAKSLTDPEIDELIEQINRRERPKDDYWYIMFAKDLLAAGIEPKIAPPGWKIVARFGGKQESIEDDWECRKAGQYRAYFGTAAEIEEYKAANQKKEPEATSQEGPADSDAQSPKATG